MRSHVRANLWLIGLTLVLCSVIYPGVLLVIGQTVFHSQAEGSLIFGDDGKLIGSRLIAQPFAGEEYFHSRPSAASYNGAASGASNWGANNYLLRERVARQIGPIVKYAGGLKRGELVGPDVEIWFQHDEPRGDLGIVARWAQSHPAVAQNWVKMDKRNADFVVAWQAGHRDEVDRWIRENRGNPQPKPEDLAVAFFTSFSKEHPGSFPMAIEATTAAGPTAGRLEPMKTGIDIQGIFFDMWRQEHPQVELEPIPADMVMASGSGLDPDITLSNALYQLDRVAARWAAKTRQDVAEMRREIELLLRQNATSPLGGIAGVPLINVLEINLTLKERYG